MTAPTDPRAEARALIDRADHKTNGNNWWSVHAGDGLNLCEELRDALEAALEQNETLERVDTTARDYIRSCDDNLAASKQRRMPDISGEQRALNALRRALDS